MNLYELGEFGLIARIQERLAQRAGVRLGIGDDAALLNALAAPVVTCDALVEQVHFRRDWISPRELGRKAITVNVSDIAAMGGRPVAAFITLALSDQDDVEFVEELYAGFEEAAARYDLTIAGGDTVRSPSALMLSVTLIGDAPTPMTRGGARPGDVLLVTGTLGDAAAGLALLQASSAGKSVEV
ncbi:MAG: thiamine-phosphate kinase, partial [Armatimonadota bacterium]|nr:thiamine-phosphate kinase [Armatimonadota bacterium]